MAAAAAGSKKTTRLILFQAITGYGVMTTMNKQTTFLLLSLLALLSILAPAAGAAPKRADTPKQPAEGQHELTIFFANDVRGETEPCG
jgi:hypothetical protein